MLFLILADMVVITHFLFALFVIFGGFLVLYNRRWGWVHVPAALWGAFVEFMDWLCPLTPLENWLRNQGGGTVYHSDFVEHYIASILYPPFLTEQIQIILGFFVVAVNICIYGWIIRRNKRK